MSVRVFLLILVSLVFVQSARARVFNFKDESFGAYFGGTGGLTSVGQEGFVHSSGEESNFTEKSSYNFTGELGFLWLLSDSANLRIGFEVMQPSKVVDQGKSANGDELFDLASDIFVSNPQLTLEYTLSGSSDSRYLGLFGIGWATVSLTNSYEMKTAGQTLYGVTEDYVEKVSASGVVYTIGAGAEYLVSDSTTALLTAGYRYAPIQNFNYSQDVANPIGGVPQTDGAAALNSGGDQRKLDLSGFYLGLLFRFYISVL